MFSQVGQNTVTFKDCIHFALTYMMMIGMFMVSSTIAESVEAHQRSFDRGIQIGHQRRNKVGFSLYMLN